LPHLGLAVYFWGRSPQNRLITEYLAPTARELLSAGLIESFWFDRFDARGPHVFAVFTAPPSSTAEVGRRVAERVERYLAENPSREEMTAEQVAAHHAGCRGKVQCEADAYPGLADNNTFFTFEHPPAGYPYWLLAGHPGERELLLLLGDLALWAVDQLAARPDQVPTLPAIRWAAALDRELAAAGRNPAEYWRYHATTLILPLAERLATAEDEVLRSLPASVGEKNRQTFARLWREAEEGATPWPPVRRLAEVAAPEPGGEGTPRQRWGLLREIVHITLKQLGVPVGLHIPLLLFAWSHSLPAPSSPPVGGVEAV
jgi:Lantibiotic biosynthesis dehydratase C-term